jgi:transcriptional regulator with XRE-family HTH domain
MPVKRIGDSNGWVREALKTCGYTQRDLARAWGVAEPSVSRFISGVEGHDPSLSRAMTLCSMLNITLEQLARGLALKGRRIEPAITSDVGLPPVGTFKMDMISPGLVRVVMVQDVTPTVASQMVAVLGGAGPAPAPAGPEIPGKK